MSDVKNRLNGGVAQFRTLPLYWRIAGIASVVWLVLVAIYGAGFFFGGAAPRAAVFLEVMIFLLAGLLPVVFFLVAGNLAQSAARLAAQVDRLEGRMSDASRIRQAAVAGADGKIDVEALIAALPQQHDPSEKLEAIDAKLRRLLDRSANPGRAQPALSETSAAPRAPQSAPAPAAPTAPPSEDLTVNDVIGALDFPFNTAEGRALVRKVRSQPEMAALMRAAEDLLNALSDDSIFVDDLRQGRADAALWRAHAEGDEGASVAQHEGSDIAETVRGKMTADPIFADAADVFAKRFREVLAEIATEGSDDNLAALADSRTGRAYALILSAKKA
ncbi:hypothetical protein ACMA5I_02545 [Paracoccaceae bacterium GXU_MW_L88]